MERKGRGEGSRTRERKERGEVSPQKIFLRRTAPECIQGLFESLLMTRALAVISEADRLCRTNNGVE